jgi:hypothetical protein
MKYTFIAEDTEFDTFKWTQETNADCIGDVVDNFAGFLRGVGFNYNGTLEIVEPEEEPVGLWTWSSTLPNTVFDDVHEFMDAVEHKVPYNVNPEETDQAKLYKSLIDEEYAEFKEADAANDDVERIDACFDMIWVIIGYMKSRGWDCDGIWDEGAQSNLAKIDSETGKVIRRPEDGKILKPEGWSPPQFAKFTLL